MHYTPIHPSSHTGPIRELSEVSQKCDDDDDDDDLNERHLFGRYRYGRPYGWGYGYPYYRYGYGYPYY